MWIGMYLAVNVKELDKCGGELLKELLQLKFRIVVYELFRNIIVNKYYQI